MSIGGYFELETNSNLKTESFHHSLIALNTARNCLEYILTAKKYDIIYIPYFTCDVLLEPLKKLNINYKFYDVDNNLEPILDLALVKENEAILITNYFGLKGKYIEEITKKNKNIIVDNAQAFFDKPIKNIDTIYSPRKFVGVADGGYLSTNTVLNIELEQDYGYDRMSHLLKRVELGAELGYNDFKSNDSSLENQSIKKMSLLTQKILSSLDFNIIAQRRKSNFELLHEKLNKINTLKIDPISDEVPMVYPLRISNTEKVRTKLLSNKIFCATYWPNVLKWCKEESNSYNLTKEIIALPIDQRYSIEDMNKILSTINL